MSSSFRPKARIMFPNRWALDGFLLRLKRSSGWGFEASSNGTRFRVRPGAGPETVLVGVSQPSRGGNVTVEIDAGKLGGGADPFWVALYDHARRYRC